MNGYQAAAASEFCGDSIQSASCYNPSESIQKIDHPVKLHMLMFSLDIFLTFIFIHDTFFRPDCEYIG